MCRHIYNCNTHVLTFPFRSILFRRSYRSVRLWHQVCRWLSSTDRSTVTVGFDIMTATILWLCPSAMGISPWSIARPIYGIQSRLPSAILTIAITNRPHLFARYSMYETRAVSSIWLTPLKYPEFISKPRLIVFFLWNAIGFAVE